MNKEYSKRSPAVKRLMKEAQELCEPTEQYYAQPLEDNLFEWHFTVRGPPDSEFDNGVYHGRITLPPEYPMRPPSIIILTPTGRFDVGTKICLSISGHHPETWQPSWSIRTVLLAIIGFMPTKGEGAIGSLDYTSEERKTLARKSQDWKCNICEVPNKSILPKVTLSKESQQIQREACAIAAQISFKKEDKSASSDKKPSTIGASTNQPPPNQPGNPENIGPATQNPFAMFNNQQLQFQPGMFQFPPNFMNQGQMPPQNPNQSPSQSQTNQPMPNQSQSNPASVVNNQLPGQSSNRQAASSSQVNPSTPSTSSAGSEVRQRSVPSRIGTPPRSSTNQEPSNQSNRTEVATRSGDTWAITLMFLFSLIITYLILRRLYVTYEYKLDESQI